MAEQKILGRNLEKANKSDCGDWKELFSDLKRLLVEAFGTPWWISELSELADEVRERTILVKINSQLHPVNDLVIYHVFSEIGVVDDVVYSPVESGFHSRVRFQNKHARDWAYHYYNGRCLHQGCCKLEIHRPNDVIRWNVEKVAEIKADYGITQSSVVTNDEHVLEKKLENDGLLSIDEESTRTELKDESSAAKELSHLTAHQLFDELLNPQNCIEHEPCVELSNYNGQGVFEMAGGIKGGVEPPTYIDEVQTNDHDRSTEEVLEIDGDLSQDLVARHVLEEMSRSTKTIEVIGVLTKDDDDDDLLEMASWVEEDFEPNSAKESSVLVAHQVLDKMPRSFVSDELIFLDEIEKINEELVDGFNWEATPMSSVEELEGVKVLKESKLRNTIPTTHALKLPTEFSEKESMMNGVVCVICFDPGGNNPSHRDHAMCLSNKNFESAAGEDHISVDGIFSELRKSYFAAGQDTQISCAAEHELQVAAAHDGLKVFRGGMTMIYMGLMCFDPGGLVASVVRPVNNDLGGLDSTSLLHNYTSCLAIYHKLAFGVNCAMSRIRGILRWFRFSNNPQPHNYTEIEHPFTCIVCLGLIVKAQIAWSNLSCNICTKVTATGLYNQVLIDFLPLLHGNKSILYMGRS